MFETRAGEGQMREEEGVRIYSGARVYREAVCDICLQDVSAVAELSRTDIYDAGASRSDTLDLCEGCAYRIGALFAPHNAGKELYCGVMQDAD
jgi:hypothetical protein